MIFSANNTGRKPPPPFVKLLQFPIGTTEFSDSPTPSPYGNPARSKPLVISVSTTSPPLNTIPIENSVNILNGYNMFRRIQPTTNCTGCGK